MSDLEVVPAMTVWWRALQCMANPSGLTGTGSGTGTQ